MCQGMVVENEFRCRKPSYLKMNPPPGNVTEVFVKLGNDYSMETLWILERVRIIKPLEYDAKYNVMKAFKVDCPPFIPLAMYHPSTFQMI